MYLWDYYGNILNGVWEAEQLQETASENWLIWSREQGPGWKNRTVRQNQTNWLFSITPRLSISLWWALIWWLAGAIRLWLQEPVVPNSNNDERKHGHLTDILLDKKTCCFTRGGQVTVVFYVNAVARRQLLLHTRAPLLCTLHWQQVSAGEVPTPPRMMKHDKNKRVEWQMVESAEEGGKKELPK